MASIIKSNTYADFNGREILTANNDGALTTQKTLYPAFEAYLNGTSQSVSDGVWTIIQFDTEKFDTNNAYDTSNYSFTVPTGYAGKYLFNSTFLAYAAGSKVIEVAAIRLEVNGNTLGFIGTEFKDTSLFQWFSPSLTSVIDLNEGDVVKVQGYVNVSSGSPSFYSNSGDRTRFQGYRIGS